MALVSVTSSANGPVRLSSEQGCCGHATEQPCAAPAQRTWNSSAVVDADAQGVAGLAGEGSSLGYGDIAINEQQNREIPETSPSAPVGEPVGPRRSVTIRGRCDCGRQCEARPTTKASEEILCDDSWLLISSVHSEKLRDALRGHPQPSPSLTAPSSQVASLLRQIFLADLCS